MDEADKAFDVIIAGGGPAGVLAAARLAAARPEARIALIEKDAALGGRLRASSAELRQHSYGLNAISDGLFEFWNQTLKASPEAPDLTSLQLRRQTRIGVLAAGRLTQAEIEQWFSPKGARTLGGLTAARQWGEVEDIVRQGASKAVEEDDEDDAEEGDKAEAQAEEKTAKAGNHPFAHYWKKPRKAPAAVVLEHFGSAFGIPDVWGASAGAIAERAQFHAGRLHCGSWDDAIQALVDQPSFQQAVTVETNNRIADARDEDGLWRVQTERGVYRARSLLVAQPPWVAAGWLKRTAWPAQLLQVASKTKPVSVVVLTEKLLKADADLPDVIIIPSERVQAVRNAPGEIAFQATIDYEMSLQAPAVVKAVKGLKRARKKLQLLYPDLITETGFVALQPIAWAQSPAQSDKRWLERLGRKPFNSATLAFAGDAYGASYDGDANLVKSVVAACDAFAGEAGG